mgnify:CR=1 FL=1
MERFRIERAPHNANNELAEGITISPLGLVEAMMLIEALGHVPSYTDRGIHSWYGNAVMASSGGLNLSRAFTLTVDQWGHATVAVDRRTLGRLFDRCLDSLIRDDMIVAIPA